MQQLLQGCLLGDMGYLSPTQALCEREFRTNERQPVVGDHLCIAADRKRRVGEGDNR
jgi:hypothetical protein